MGGTKVAAFVLALGVASICPSRAQAIVAGRAAAPGEAPFAVALVVRGQPAASSVFCGGSLVAPGVVVTAAHCVLGKRPSRVDVVAGRQRLDTIGGDRVPVARIAIAKGYDRHTDAHDIAVLRLARPSDAGAPIALPGAGAQPVAGSAAITYGWGLVSRHQDLISKRLRAGELRIRSGRRCSELYDGDFGRAVDVCASSPADRGAVNACEGDSGGPLATGPAGSETLVGVVSYGLGACSSRRHPDVFAKVSADVRWLRRLLTG